MPGSESSAGERWRKDYDAICVLPDNKNTVGALKEELEEEEISSGKVWGRRRLRVASLHEL